MIIAIDAKYSGTVVNALTWARKGVLEVEYEDEEDKNGIYDNEVQEKVDIVMKKESHNK